MKKQYDLTGVSTFASEQDDDIVKAALEFEPEGKSRPELLEAQSMANEAMEILVIACSSIQSQIDSANLRRDTTGYMADPHWYRRVHGAQRSKRWQRQRLQDKIGEINRALRQTTGRAQEGLFVQVARLHLPKETYERLWALVLETENLKGKKDG